MTNGCCRQSNEYKAGEAFVQDFLKESNPVEFHNEENLGVEETHDET